MTTMRLGIARPPAVDKKLLSDEDYEQYQTLLKRWDRGPTSWEPTELIVASALFCVVGFGGLFGTLLWADTLPQEQGDRVIPLALGLLLAALVPYVWFALRSRKRWWMQLTADADTFLRERIKGAPPRADVDDDDPGRTCWWTGNFDPPSYHKSFRGMTPEYREYVSHA